jgi:nicotinic acid mononucleotide adenylyltransferase
MGFDSLLNLTSWTRAGELLNILSTVYVTSRQEKEEEQLRTADEVKKLNPAINIVFLGHHQHENLSSTKLRK